VIAFKLTVDRDVLKQLSTAAPEAVKRALAEGLKAVLPKGAKAAALSPRFRQRSGRMSAGWRRAKPKIRVRGAKVSGKIGTRHKGAHMLDEGGAVLPKQTFFIKVPLQRAKSGKARQTRKKLFVLKAKDDRLYLASRSKARKRKNSKLTLWYMLREWIRLRPTWYATKAVDALAPTALRDFNAAIQRELNKSPEEWPKTEAVL